MSINAKDAGTAELKPLKTTLDTGEHAIHHNVDNSALPDGAATEITLQAVLAGVTDLPYPTPISAFPTTAVDAFNRLRVSSPGYRFDSQFTYQIDSDLWDTAVSGGTPGTVDHSANERWALMTAPAAGSIAILQSHYHSPYTPGRGQLAFITFLFGDAPETGAVRKVGYWDGSNGIYLEQSASGVNLVLASDTSSGDETVPQADWNIDTLGGGALNPSGLTLDLTKMQILVIQMQALYVGRVTVAFDIGGALVTVHVFNCANEASFPYIQQASLPVRYEVTTGDAAVAMAAVCASVISEGGNDLVAMAGREFSADMGVTEVTVGATEIPLISIQVAAQLNSINQNAIVIPLGIDVSVATDPILVRVRRNATLTDASYSAVSAAESVVNKDVAATAVSGGRVIESFYLPASNSIRSVGERGLAGKTVMCYRHLATAVGDTLTVTAQATTGTGAIALAAVKWKEIR